MAEEEVKAPCPRCGVLIRWEGNPYRPFCSERCKLIDLGRWVDGEYRIEGEVNELPMAITKRSDEQEGQSTRRGGGS